MLQNRMIRTLIKRKTIFIAALTAIMLFASCKPKSQHEQIDQAMKKFYKEGAFNGSILVVAKGKVLYDTAMGYADFRTRKPLDTGSVFYLASLSKQFTSMGIMMLQHEHKLSYSDKLSQYFPQLPPYTRHISIQNLLNHTSGIKDYFEVKGLVKPGLDNQQVLQWLTKEQKPDFPAGSKYLYSNTGYLLLALVIEKVSGKTFPDFMKQMIFSPLKMNHSLVYQHNSPMIKNRAAGFNKDKEPDDYTILTTGDGGLFSTTHDLYKWDQALYAEKLLNQAELSAAFRRPKLNNGKPVDYGFGWDIQGEPGKNLVVFHTGELNGYQTYIYRDLLRHNTIILLSNQGRALQMADIAGKIQKILKP